MSVATKAIFTQSRPGLVERSSIQQAHLPALAQIGQLSVNVSIFYSNRRDIRNYSVLF